MSHSEENPKWRWWRPRYSVRTLVILVTLVGVYFGPCWEATKRYGVPPTKSTAFVGMSPNTVIVRGDAPFPLIVRKDLMLPFQPGRESQVTHYYLWLFGVEFKLPFESKWKFSLKL